MHKQGGGVIGGVHCADTPNILVQYAIMPEKGPSSQYASTVHYAITSPKIGHYVITPRKQ